MSFLKRFFGRDPWRAKLERHRRELAERKEVLRNEEIKLNLSLRDLEELKRLEEELTERGRKEESEVGRRTLAYRIRDIRERHRGVESRIRIYENRIRVLREQIASLETLVEAGAGGLPDEKAIEEASYEASRTLEHLNQLLLRVEGTRQEDREDEEVLSILKEFEARAEREKRRRAVEGPRRERPGREPPEPEPPGVVNE